MNWQGRWRAAVGMWVAICAALPACAAMIVRDDGGSELHLAAPARRIVSLAPNATELLFAAGAGARIVGTVEYSDWPAAAKALPHVGSVAQIDAEAVAALQPDLVIAWQSGTPPAAIAKLRGLGLTVYVEEPKRIDDIAVALQTYGRMAGTTAVADAAAVAFRQRYAQLAAAYSTRPKLRVFYQIWEQPLITVNGKQIISDVIRLCGGKNVFADLPVLAPTVAIEAVIAANPDVIVASGSDATRPAWLDDWRRWPSLNAVAHGNLFFVPPDLIQRHTPRLLDGAELLCRQLETARGRL